MGSCGLVSGETLPASVCDTTARSHQTIYRSYAALEPVFSGRRIDSRYTLDASFSYVSTVVGWFWTSLGDAVCMTLPERNWIIRPGSPPKPGAAERLAGSLGDAFPELRSISEESIERRLRRMRR